jgi:hypothetical protein
MKEYRIDENGRPVTPVPSMADYAMAKKQFDIGVDPGAGDEESCVVVVDRETLSFLYWSRIPTKDKRRIEIGEKHDDDYFHSLPTKT